MPEARQILDRLSRLAARDNRPSIPIADIKGAASLFTFVTHERERIAGCAFSRVSIVVIVEGAKEVISMGRHLRFAAGTVLVLPGGWRGDVVNDPDPKSGAYRAIFIDFPDDIVRRAARALPVVKAEPHFSLPLDPVLAAAIHHAGEGIASGDLPVSLVNHRIMEVLIVLGMRGALPVKPETMADRVRALIRWQPDRAWTAELIASELGTSNATLRRRLADEGTGLREVIAIERIAAAQTMLAEDGLSLNEAALATGYRSTRLLADRLRAARTELHQPLTS
ncbi:helix-turn-helix transcriptional regulator [Rhizobium sp. BK376]|jgi:AraC-like DNA-binding protein|uniref:helix-turn-helix transcriptional regulator n=1 Tax=Rhizobium sp. BK376 TaxID=2512149 RepID=UPI00104D2DF5|nr:helix-turn-helix transcriptional regulator [Rhizobium sp. BK376]TCR93319.1 AraC family transcriptional regulator [Rhizobium sp. BK376]